MNNNISNTINSEISPIKKKYFTKKKIIAIIIIIFFIYIFFKISFSGHTPLLETCIQSDVIAQDKVNNNFIKYVECLKGYTTTEFNRSNKISQRTSGYVIFDKNGKYINTIPLERNSDNNFRQGTSPDFYFKDNNLFVTINDNSEISAVPNYNSKLLGFDDGKINKIRDISFERRYIVAYENNEIYYLNFEKQTIIKENLITGESSIIVDLSSIKRDSFYTNIYSLCFFKDKDKLMAYFFVIVSVDKKTKDQIREHYSLNLNSGQLLKIIPNSNGGVVCSSPNLEIYPNRVKYSKIEGNAATYNLKYAPNSNMRIYKLLLLFKDGIPAGTSNADLN